MSETSARLAGWAPSEPLRKDGLTGDSLPQEGWSVKDWEVQKHVSVTDRGLASDCGRWYCCGWCLSLSRAPSVRRRMHRSVARECAEYEQTAEGAV